MKLFGNCGGSASSFQLQIILVVAVVCLIIYVLYVTKDLVSIERQVHIQHQQLEEQAKHIGMLLDNKASSLAAAKKAMAMSTSCKMSMPAHPVYDSDYGSKGSPVLMTRHAKSGPAELSPAARQQPVMDIDLDEVISIRGDVVPDVPSKGGGMLNAPRTAAAKVPAGLPTVVDQLIAPKPVGDMIIEEYVNGGEINEEADNQEINDSDSEADKENEDDAQVDDEIADIMDEVANIADCDTSSLGDSDDSSSRAKAKSKELERIKGLSWAEIKLISKQRGISSRNMNKDQLIQKIVECL